MVLAAQSKPDFPHQRISGFVLQVPGLLVTNDFLPGIHFFLLSLSFKRSKPLSHIACKGEFPASIRNGENFDGKIPSKASLSECLRCCEPQ
jgi:hypothetical protein